MKSINYALLGASRGLGWETYQQLLKKKLKPTPGPTKSDSAKFDSAKFELASSRSDNSALANSGSANFFLCSRKILQNQILPESRATCFSYDFSKNENPEAFLAELQKFSPSHVVYFAGGGPYGEFASHRWSSHEWCWKTCFEFPAWLTHQILSDLKKWSSVEKIILIGSAIAEDRPDPGAASYSAAKHALKGLVSSLQAEVVRPEIILFSPGYMATSLLPKKSFPYEKGLVESVQSEAEKLICLLTKVSER